MFFRILRFVLVSAAAVALISLGEMSIAVGDKNLPPIGRFFNPFSGFWRNAEPSAAVPGRFEKFGLSGLQAPVEVVFDELDIPHIFANNLQDAYLVQGYLVARDRLWQMDLVSRSASGRLSEVMGTRTLNLDRLTRRQGMVWAAEHNLASWEKSPENILLLDAYTAGVNHFVQTLPEAKRPIEFKLLDYKPERWSNLKTSLVLESMARNLCGRTDDAAATMTRAWLGDKDFNFLFPDWNPKNQPIVADFGQWKQITNKKKEEKSPSTRMDEQGFFLKDFEKLSAPSGTNTGSWTFQNDLPDPFRTIDGSNNWAVAPKKSATGNALLANDPHLSLSLPSVWYALQIHTPELNCMGVTFPGIPGIVIGFNENLAWGVTNVSHDVLDWYKIKWKDTDRTTYEVNEETKNVQFRVETFYIKDGIPLLDTVRYTDWGPLTYDHEPEHPLADCAMFWVSHLAPDPTQIGTFLKLGKSKTVGEGQNSIQNYDAPAQNFIMADRSGNIAIQVQGKLPNRKNLNGKFIQDGSSKENAWESFIPQSDLPQWRNPSRGFLFSANQHSTPPSYPHKYLGSFDDSRNQRIYNLLAAMDTATVDSMKSIQLDNFSTIAAEALPVMLQLTDTAQLNIAERQLWDELRAWQFQYDKNLTAPSCFEMWFDSAYQLTWDEFYIRAEAQKPTVFPEAWRWIDLMKKDAKHRFFDLQSTPERETAREIVTLAFKKMAVQSLLSAVSGLNWGKFKGFKISHLARLDAFSILDLETDGHRFAPNAVAATHGPSWRMIVELGDPVKAIGVYPGGQSGNPGSPFYDNMVKPWAAGEYFEMRLLSSPDELQIPLLKSTFNPLQK